MGLLALTMVFSLAACFGQHASEGESFFYVPTLKQVDPQGGVVRNAFLCGEELVYEVYYDGNGASPARYTYYVQDLMQMDAEPRRTSFGCTAGWTGINDMTRDADGNCPGRMLEREVKTETIYKEPVNCTEHPFCQKQFYYTVHYWEFSCNECGHVSREWTSIKNHPPLHSNHN